MADKDDQTRIKSLNIVGGAVHMELLPPQSFANLLVEAARASLEEASAENYVQYEIRDNKTCERFAVVVQRVGKLTPHHARKEAEGQRDTILALVADWAYRSAEYGGLGPGDLVWALEQAGYTLPSPEEARAVVGEA